MSAVVAVLLSHSDSPQVMTPIVASSRAGVRVAQRCRRSDHAKRRSRPLSLSPAAITKLPTKTRITGST
jgi:hypothetical protein